MAAAMFKKWCAAQPQQTASSQTSAAAATRVQIDPTHIQSMDKPCSHHSNSNQSQIYGPRTCTAHMHGPQQHAQPTCAADTLSASFSLHQQDSIE